jgi:hypothetical protein
MIMQIFNLELKNEKVKQYKLFALLIIFLNVAVLTILAIMNDATRYRSFGAALLVILLFIIRGYLKRKNRRYSVTAAAAAVITVGYLSLQLWWPALVMVVLAALYTISVRKLIVSVNAVYVIYPSLTKKIIGWNELSNVILKDGLLTIDFRNNKIIQHLIEDMDGFNEKDFNEFCRVHLDDTKKPTLPSETTSYDGYSEMLNMIQ